ncbi:MAG: hypothetical protein LBJ18_00965 [Rickettsiales bacterium]|nr:hypothetical protein [Rickettsiales bacterium]
MKKLLLIANLSLLICACQPLAQQQQQGPQYDLVNVVDNLVIDENSVPIFPKKAALTTDAARRFSIDLPKRCKVDWNNQSVLSVVPEEPVEIVRLEAGDPLPGFNVEEFEFTKLTVADALAKLLDGTDIAVVEDESLPGKITGSIKSGSLQDALDLITKMGKAYYSYDDAAREIHLFHRTKWLMKMPKDQSIIMALLDAMHGSDMRNLIVDWADKTVVFEGNYQTEREVAKLVSDIGSKKYMVAWDIDVYRVYPRTDNPIIWMNLLPALGENNVKMSVPGVVGRALVVGPEINTKTLQEFLSQQGNVVLISQGSFVLPNDWQSRFDIGQCSKEERLETDLIIGATAKYGDFAGMKKVDSKIVLRTSGGELSSFRLPTTLGDNYVFIGIPTHSFVTAPETLISPFAELVVFMSPRVISIVAPARETAPLSGQALRDYLEE